MITLAEIKDILEDKNSKTTEQLASKSQALTQQYFGRAIALYTPLYISNYCSSYCTYCGFSSHNLIKRIKLTLHQIEKEMAAIAHTGIQNILILTGESYIKTPLSYLKDTVEIAKQHFPNISLEVHPMEAHQYRELFHVNCQLFSSCSEYPSLNAYDVADIQFLI